MWLEYCWESRNPEHCSRETCQISGIKNVVLTYFVLTLNPSVPHSSVFIVKFGNLLAEAYSALTQTSKRRVCNSSDQPNAVPHCFKFPHIRFLSKSWLYFWSVSWESIEFQQTNSYQPSSQCSISILHEKVRKHLTFLEGIDMGHWTLVWNG